MTQVNGFQELEYGFSYEMSLILFIINFTSSPPEEPSKTSKRFFSTYSNTKYILPLRLNASFSSTMFSERYILSIFTSLQILFLTNSFSSVSLNFFMATKIRIILFTYFTSILVSTFENNSICTLSNNSLHFILIHL